MDKAICLAGGQHAGNSVKLSEVDWSCPICMDLLYKPCVNVCGHTFCFWCMHHAMNPFRPSQCPLCRAVYTHFPRVCLPLHNFLAASFPDRYTERFQENRELEASQGVESPDIPPAPPGPWSTKSPTVAPTAATASRADAVALAGSTSHAAAAAAAAATAVPSSAACASAPRLAPYPHEGATVGTNNTESGSPRSRGPYAPSDAAGCSAKGVGAAAAAQTDVQPAEPSAAPATAGVSAAYICTHPRCGRLACRPCVLSCGCLVCGACGPSCQPRGQPQQQLQQPSQRPPDHPYNQQQQQQQQQQETPQHSNFHHLQPPGPALDLSPSPLPPLRQQSDPEQAQCPEPPGPPWGPAGGLATCPACGMGCHPRPKACHKLEEALRFLYPREYAKREQELQATEETAAAAARTDLAASSECGGGGSSMGTAGGGGGTARSLGPPPSWPSPGSAQLGPGTPGGLEREQLGGEANAGGQQPAEQNGGESRRTRPRSKLPRIDALIAAAAAAGADPAGTAPAPSITDIWSALREELAAHADTCFTWYSVGCDDCGVFPIVGRRYRCRDCCERIGYDLCGTCHDLGIARRGRFNQAHTAGHRLEKVEPCFGGASSSSSSAAATTAAAAAAMGAGAAGNGSPYTRSALAVRGRPGGDSVQVLTLMNYLEVLHPELTVEQATSLVLMNLGGMALEWMHALGQWPPSGPGAAAGVGPAGGPGGGGGGPSSAGERPVAAGIVTWRTVEAGVIVEYRIVHGRSGAWGRGGAGLRGVGEGGGGGAGSGSGGDSSTSMVWGGGGVPTVRGGGIDGLRAAAAVAAAYGAASGGGGGGGPGAASAAAVVAAATSSTADNASSTVSGGGSGGSTGRGRRWGGWRLFSQSGSRGGSGSSSGALTSPSGATTSRPGGFRALRSLLSPGRRGSASSGAPGSGGGGAAGSGGFTPAVFEPAAAASRFASEQRRGTGGAGSAAAGPGGSGGSSGPDRRGQGGRDRRGQGGRDRRGQGGPDRRGQGGRERWRLGGGSGNDDSSSCVVQ